jgi:hypothetical protein
VVLCEIDKKVEIAVLAEPIPKILWSFQMALWQVTRVDSAAESLALTPACTTKADGIKIRPIR